MSTYQVHAIRYATWQDRPATHNFIDTDIHEGPMPLDFFVWAIVGEDRTIVVDTGFDEASGEKRGRELLRPVRDGLARIGVEAAEVRDVVITHMHWDHAGNTDLFPKARYHVQAREMEYCTGRCMCHSHLRRPYDVEDVTAMVRRTFEGRTEFHDGSREIAPGVSVHWVGGHSKGLQVVRVRTGRGHVVLASDAMHYYRQIEENRPFRVVHDVEDMLEGYRTLHRLADGPDRIVAGHDPLVLVRYPSGQDGTEDIVRLDLPPRP